MTAEALPMDVGAHEYSMSSCSGLAALEDRTDSKTYLKNIFADLNNRLPPKWLTPFRSQKAFTPEKRQQFFARLEALDGPDAANQRDFIALNLWAYADASYTGSGVVPGRMSADEMSACQADAQTCVDQQHTRMMLSMQKLCAKASEKGISVFEYVSKYEGKSALMGAHYSSLPEAIRAMALTVETLGDSFRDKNGDVKAAELVFERSLATFADLGDVISPRDPESTVAPTVHTGGAEVQQAPRKGNVLVGGVKKVVKEAGHLTNQLAVKPIKNLAAGVTDSVKDVIQKDLGLKKKKSRESSIEKAPVITEGPLKGFLRIDSAEQGHQQVKRILQEMPAADEKFLRGLNVGRSRSLSGDQRKRLFKILMDDLPTEDGAFLTALWMGHGEVGGEYGLKGVTRGQALAEAVGVFQANYERGDSRYDTFFELGGRKPTGDGGRAAKFIAHVNKPFAYSSWNVGTNDLRARAFPGMFDSLANDGPFKGKGNATSFDVMLQAYADWTSGNVELRNFGVQMPDGTVKPYTHFLSYRTGLMQSVERGGGPDWAYTSQEILRKSGSHRKATWAVYFPENSPQVKIDGVWYTLRAHGYGTQFVAIPLGTLKAAAK